MVLLCDGRLVCGCADPYGKRVLGDARTETRLGGLDRRDARRRCASDLNAGGSKFCGDCPLKLPLKKDERAAAARPRRRRRCPRGSTSSAPPPATSRAPRRAARRKPASRARARPACSTSSCSAASIDEAGPSLGRIDFFNYGEAFLHKRAVEMCEYIKARFPHIYLYTSTNGLAFTEEQVAAAGALGHRRSDVLDRRRDAGQLRRSTGSAETSPRRSATCAPRRTRSARRAATFPFINWRYILFTHNDSDEEMNAARATWRPTSASIACAGSSPIIPEDLYSRRFVPGSAALAAIKHEIWDDNNLGNAIPGATPRARDRRQRPAAAACR